MNTKIQIKTPITYYGGKQQMLHIILPLMPAHTTYVEPFCGGGAVFFAKERAKNEVINDTNREVINFYEVTKTNFEELKVLVNKTLHSRKQHANAKVIYENPDMFSKIERAWAFWLLSSQSMFGIIGNSWSTGKSDNKVANKVFNAKSNFVLELSQRFDKVQIECRDALDVIKAKDSLETFHYIDPPYYNANMGHYAGYTKQDFEELLLLLSCIKGKFLLSSYPCPVLRESIKKFGWSTKEYDLYSPASQGKKRKKEVLTSNYCSFK